MSSAGGVLLGLGEGEETSDGERKSVLIKAGLPELAVTESRYAAGESGPSDHVHHEHADGFYVLDGRLVFELEGERVELGAGGFALVPPEVVHTFRNEGPGDARFLNFHAPSREFHRQLRGEDVDFDDDDPPPGGGRPPADAIVRGPGEGERLAIGPSEGLLKAQGDEADGFLSLNEVTLAPGFPGPVPHLHETFVDSFYVLEGVLTLQLGDERVDAGPGTFAAIPTRTVHTFANESDAPVRALNVMAPGGFERYLKEVAAVMRPGEPPDPARMAEIAARYDFKPAAG